MSEARQAVCVALEGTAVPWCCSELSQTLSHRGSCSGWAGRHRSLTVGDTPGCKVTTEISHVDLEFKKDLHVSRKVISWLVLFRKSAETK